MSVLSLTVVRGMIWAWFGLGLATFVTLWFVTAPYDRHSRNGWGPAISARLGWILMEIPAVATVAALFLASRRQAGLGAFIFLAMWELHYAQRTFVFPFLLPRGASLMPFWIAALGFVFNLFNGCLQGFWLFRIGPVRGAEWLADPRFLLGAALFIGGMTLNWHSDAVLRALREPGESGYRIPQGGLYRWVSCPNYLGEVIEWTGWAVATWSLAGAAFAFWTAANLVPRAFSHHRWYRRHFPGYPEERRALIPYW